MAQGRNKTTGKKKRGNGEFKESMNGKSPKRMKRTGVKKHKEHNEHKEHKEAEDLNDDDFTKMYAEFISKECKTLINNLDNKEVDKKKKLEGLIEATDVMFDKYDWCQKKEEEWKDYWNVVCSALSMEQIVEIPLSSQDIMFKMEEAYENLERENPLRCCGVSTKEDQVNVAVIEILDNDDLPLTMEEDGLEITGEVN